MKLKDLSQMFNRSAGHVFAIPKCFFLFMALIFFGLIFLFFQGFAIYAPNWLKLPLICIPLFLLVAFLMASGAILIKAYAQEREGNTIMIKELFLSSRKLILRASYFALPLLLAFVAFWALAGFFVLLKSIPYLGPFLGVIFSFAPFLLNLGILLLFFIALLLLFFFTPLLAFNEKIDRKILIDRLRSDLFTHLLLLGVAVVPFWIVWFFVSKALALTFATYSAGDTVVEMVLQSLFMLIPLAAILTLPLTFFFNFSLESYLMTRTTEQDK